MEGDIALTPSLLMIYMVCSTAAEIEKKIQMAPDKKNTKNLISCILYFF